MISKFDIVCPKQALHMYLVSLDCMTKTLSAVNLWLEWFIVELKAEIAEEKQGKNGLIC